MPKSTPIDPKAIKAYKRVKPVLDPLLDLFATVDDVMTEPDAFSDTHIKSSLGRVYRSWLSTRIALDPDFNPDKYRHEMKTNKTPLGNRKPTVSRSPKSSTARSLTSEKNTNRTAKREKNSAKTSAKNAKSNGRALSGRSTTKKNSEFGED